MNDALALIDIHAGGFPVSFEYLCSRDGTADTSGV
jgi:hypothetical protein